MVPCAAQPDIDESARICGLEKEEFQCRCPSASQRALATLEVIENKELRQPDL
jgi:hypothetical protein